MTTLRSILLCIIATPCMFSYDKSSYDPLIRKAASLGYETDDLFFNPKRVID